jgi:hypothetical protein
MTLYPAVSVPFSSLSISLLLSRIGARPGTYLPPPIADLPCRAAQCVEKKNPTAPARSSSPCALIFSRRSVFVGQRKIRPSFFTRSSLVLHFLWPLLWPVFSARFSSSAQPLQHPVGSPRWSASSFQRCGSLPPIPLRASSPWCRCPLHAAKLHYCRAGSLSSARSISLLRFLFPRVQLVPTPSSTDWFYGRARSFLLAGRESLLCASTSCASAPMAASL